MSKKKKKRTLGLVVLASEEHGGMDIYKSRTASHDLGSNNG
jgi:hypothetical protein